MTQYIIENISVRKVYEPVRQLGTTMVNGQPQTLTEKLGWFVQLEGSFESLFLGTEKPDFVVGDRVDLILRKSKLTDTVSQTKPTVPITSELAHAI